MLYQRIIPVLLAATVFLGSCRAGKTLEVVRGENETLHTKVQQLEKENNQAKQQIAQLTAQSQSMVNDFDRYKAECQETQNKLRAAQSILRDEYATLKQIENKIDDALSDFSDKGVEVHYENGLVYVSMEDNLLYKSGSAKLGDDGKKALSSLVNVLNSYPDLKLVVVGNTDDAQFKKGGTDNWSLSTERANGVVRALRDDYKVDPARLTAAGRGKYHPVADNATAEGKAKNRRTDIIINPDLVKLWQSAEQQ